MTTPVPRVVSGVRPSGGLHVGQYFGAISQWVSLQHLYPCFFGLADLHEISFPYRQSVAFAECDDVGRSTVEAAMELMACGLDPEVCTLFVQSLVPELTEVFTLLNCLVSYRDLKELPLFAASYKNIRPSKHWIIPGSLLTYPVLQAADILGFKGDVVPVGKDQVQHVRIAQRLASAVNRRAGRKLLPVPEARFSSTPDIMSLAEPGARMGKKRGPAHFIGLFEDDQSIRRKLIAAKTDGSALLASAGAGASTANLLEILRACGAEQETELRAALGAGRLRYADLREAVALALIDLIAPLREKRAALDYGESEEVVRESSLAAREAVREVVRELRHEWRLLEQKSGTKGNWWRFSIDVVTRASKDSSRLIGYHEVNPVRDGRRQLSYKSYLALGELLAAQEPSSKIPDERMFIIGHQLIELVFKQMVFDLAVLGETFQSLLTIPRDKFIRRLASEGYEDSFWRPAMTSASRLNHSATEVLPTVLDYFARDELFRGEEFYSFRDNLPPASGFQSAQFRLIQRALGKGAVLSVRLFPDQEFRRNYGIEGEGPTSVVDRLVLQDEVATASPTAGRGEARAAGVDDLALSVLARLAHDTSGSRGERESLHMSDSVIEEITAAFRRSLRPQQGEANSEDSSIGEPLVLDPMAVIFRTDFAAAVKTENARRSSFHFAREGANILRERYPDGNLSAILEKLVSVDEALHGATERGFLRMHYDIANRRVEQVRKKAEIAGEAIPASGSAGGGVEYLAFTLGVLLPLFPAVCAFRRYDIGQDQRPLIDFDG